MGMRSNVEYCELYTDNLKLFISNIMAEKLGCELDKKSLWDSIEIDHETEEIYMEWNNWKISGYWYKDFCNFLIQLQQYRLRGSVTLDDINGVKYDIVFDNKGVEVHFGTDYYGGYNYKVTKNRLRKCENDAKKINI